MASDALSILLAYVTGSLPFAARITRWRAGRRVREVGIGNAGARNVWHVVGPWWGFLVAVMDVAKGSAAVLISRALGVSPIVQLLAGPAAIVGHCFPLFERFQGGKGLATAYGVLLAWMPLPTLASMVTFALAQLLVRNMDRSVVVGAATAIFLPPVFGYSWAMALYALALFLMLAARSLQDRAHERQVWASSGWENVGSHDWYGASDAVVQPRSGSPDPGARE